MSAGRRGGPGDWLAPLTALAVVLLLAWAAAAGLRHFGYAVPWTSGPMGGERAANSASPSRDPSGTTGTPPGDVQAGLDASGDPVRLGPGVDERDRERTRTGTAPRERAAPVDPGPPVPGRPVVTPDDVDDLRDRDLELPVRGITRDDLRSTFQDARGDRLHEAIDILAPRGTPVIAIEDGTVAKLFESVPGGLTIYLKDPTGTYAYYYAHLDGYAPGLVEGASIDRGDVIGYVGTTGNAPRDTPHLHFTIYKLGPQQRWWEGTPIDPYLVLR
jgi:murein DD-endopeptidase MepM/ murein hydrolase activator NlpD